MMDKKQKKRKDAFATPGNSNRSTPASAASMASNALTKSADNQSRASSSKSVTSSTKSINKSDDLGSSLSKPELITGYDLRAHLQQIMKFSDDDFDDDDDDTLYSSEEEYSIESFDDKDDRDEELRQLAAQSNDDGEARTPLPTGMNNFQALVPITEEEGDDLDSEEENEIMKEIRNEIVNNVRQEMKSELELYKAKMKKLENSAEGTPNEPGSDQSAGNLQPDLDNLDPKLRAAIIKMKKLDKMLSKRIRREKEVKRDRILLERRIKKEIEELHREKKDEYKEVLNNEQKFLALELPARHNEGVTVPDEFTGEEVFATQLNEDDYPGLKPESKSKKGHRTGRSSQRSDKDSVRTGSDDEQSRGDASSVTSGSVDGKHKKKRKKDFIKRNKELAGDAANLIAMTDEEKKRLDDLLKDVEDIPDIPVGADLDENNPFQLAVRPGEGFQPEPDEMRSLTSIDSRLKELMPPDDYQSIASSSLSHVPQNKLFTRTGVKHEVDWESRGERALFQNAEQREMNDRMLAIEQELATLKNREESELETPRLGDDQLKDLIDQCVTSLSYTSMSRMTLNTESRTSFADTESVVSHHVESMVDNTPRSPRSARQEILDNPPKLAPEVLQKLLSEAYHPLSKQLTTLNEEENEEEETTPIPSEVWKLISMETVDESKSGDTVQSSYDSQMLTSVSESFSDSNNVSGMMGKNQVNSRNGFRALSRNSSASSLASVSEMGTGRETREKEPLKLPDIDPSGSLVTQGINNQRRTGSSNSVVRTPSNFVHNGSSDSKSDNFGPSDSRMELLSLDGDIMSPHPPSRDKLGKREGSGNKSRNGSRTHIS